MRILQIHNFYQVSGGEDRAVKNEKELLEREGNDVIRYSRHNNEIKQYGFLGKIKFFFEAFYSLRTYREVSALVERAKPDIAHIHNVFPLISPSVYCCLKKKRIPIVQTVHNFRFFCPAGLFFAKGKICRSCETGNTLPCLLNKCYKESFVLSGLYAFVFFWHRARGTFKKNIGRFACLNKFTREKFSAGGYPENKLDILGNFLPDIPRPLEFVKEDYAVYLGRLSAEKGLLTLVKAFGEIKNFRLKIAGYAGIEGEIREFIRRHKITNIEMLGAVGEEARSELLGKAAFSIIPSECYENFPLAALESFSAGTAVLAADIGGLPELIIGNENGILFEPGNSKDLAQKARYLFERPLEAREMGRKGYVLLREKYSPQIHYEGLIKAYRQAIKQNAKMNILGTYVSRTDYAAAAGEIIRAAKEGRSFAVAALAVHGIMEGIFNPSFRAKLNNFDLVTPDGKPVKWAMNLMGGAEIKERVCGPELMLRVLRRAEEEKLPVFLYGSGSRKDALERLRRNLLNLFPGLIICKEQIERFAEPPPQEDQADIDLINRSQARIIFIGRGCPRQEKWIAAHLGRINAAMIGVGAAFDFYSGDIKRAPVFLQRLGLEWLFRLMQEPRRLWRRYLILNPFFLLNIFLQWSGLWDFEK